MRDFELVEEFYQYRSGEVVKSDIYIIDVTKDSILIPVRDDDIVIGAVFLSRDEDIVIKADTVVFTDEGAVGEPTVRNDAHLLFISDMTVSATPVADPYPIIGLTREECLEKAKSVLDNMGGESWRSQVRRANWKLGYLEPSFVAYCPSFNNKTKFFLIGKDDKMVVIDGKHVIVRKGNSLVDVGPDGVIIAKGRGKIVHVGKHGVRLGDFMEIGKHGIKFGDWHKRSRR
ncbi:MAG: hypothetical protein ACFFC7_32165 [Candidatus Hermodarchaeota archaeon]